jgi:glutathione synthase/RimK-type ligase-like ATP-grasp enzyme
VGLPIPRTLITNDAAAARRFSEELGLERTVYKTFLATERHWRETRILHQDELDLLDRVALAPVIFQEYVPAVADIRVTVFGDELFATAITPAPGGYDVDYRMDLPGAGFTPTDLPDETIGGIRSLMRRLGLVYGAIDLRRTAEGEHVFLEVNPAGEWRFVEDRTGQPMTEAMAGLLAGLDRR